MPTNLPGFLVFAGLVLFVISFFSGEITIKYLKLRLPGPAAREVLRWVGGCLFVGGIGLFGYYESWWTDLFGPGDSTSPRRQPVPLMKKQ